MGYQSEEFISSTSSQAISAADMVIVMDKGKLKWAGTLSCFLLSPYMTVSALEASKDSSLQLAAKENSVFFCEKLNSDNQLRSNCMSVSKEVQDTTDVEERKMGRVEFSVYK